MTIEPAIQQGRVARQTSGEGKVPAGRTSVTRTGQWNEMRERGTLRRPGVPGRTSRTMEDRSLVRVAKCTLGTPIVLFCDRLRLAPSTSGVFAEMNGSLCRQCEHGAQGSLVRRKGSRRVAVEVVGSRYTFSRKGLGMALSR